MTFLNSMPADTAIEIMVMLYDLNGNNINSSRLHPANGDAFSLYWLAVSTSPWDAQIIQYQDYHFGCAFSCMSSIYSRDESN